MYVIRRVSKIGTKWYYLHGDDIPNTWVSNINDASKYLTISHASMVLDILKKDGYKNCELIKGDE